MASPITRVLDASGQEIHSCEALGCEVSWDGYVLASGLVIEATDLDDPSRTVTLAYVRGDRVRGASDPGEEWDTSIEGVARLRPADG